MGSLTNQILSSHFGRLFAFRTSILAEAVCLTTEERRSESPEGLLPVREVFASSLFFPATGFWVVAG